MGTHVTYIGHFYAILLLRHGSLTSLFVASTPVSTHIALNSYPGRKTMNTCRKLDNQPIPDKEDYIIAGNAIFFNFPENPLNTDFCVYKLKSPQSNKNKNFLKAKTHNGRKIEKIYKHGLMDTLFYGDDSNDISYSDKDDMIIGVKQTITNHNLWSCVSGKNYRISVNLERSADEYEYNRRRRSGFSSHHKRRNKRTKRHAQISFTKTITKNFDFECTDKNRLEFLLPKNGERYPDTPRIDYQTSITKLESGEDMQGNLRIISRVELRLQGCVDF